MKGAKERFESKFEKTDGCWNWLFGKTWVGYGKFFVNGKTLHAHRYAYELYVGPIPVGMDILHSCDNRACVNPAHLRPGTHKENMDERDRKGRGNPPVGVRASTSKLTEDQVTAIFHDKRTQQVIAAEYGIYQSLVSKIKNGERWAHLGLKSPALPHPETAQEPK